jgi:hypothetical protein
MPPKVWEMTNDWFFYRLYLFSIFSAKNAVPLSAAIGDQDSLFRIEA